MLSLVEHKKFYNLGACSGLKFKDANKSCILKTCILVQ